MWLRRKRPDSQQPKIWPPPNEICPLYLPLVAITSSTRASWDSNNVYKPLIQPCQVPHMLGSTCDLVYAVSLYSRAYIRLWYINNIKVPFARKKVQLDIYFFNTTSRDRCCVDLCSPFSPTWRRPVQFFFYASLPWFSRSSRFSGHQHNLIADRPNPRGVRCSSFYPRYKVRPRHVVSF